MPVINHLGVIPPKAATLGGHDELDPAELHAVVFEGYASAILPGRQAPALGGCQAEAVMLALVPDAVVHFLADEQEESE